VYKFTDSTKYTTQREQSWTTVEKVYLIIRLVLKEGFFPPRCKRAFLLLSTSQDDKNSANSLRLKTGSAKLGISFCFTLLAQQESAMNPFATSSSARRKKGVFTGSQN